MNPKQSLLNMVMMVKLSLRRQNRTLITTIKEEIKYTLLNIENLVITTIRIEILINRVNIRQILLVIKLELKGLKINTKLV